MASILHLWIRICGLCILCCALIVHGNHDAKRLYDFLLRHSHYNKLIRPVANTSDIIVVEMGIKLTQIIDVDEKNEILSLNMWVMYNWVDVNLQWEPQQFGDVDMLYVPSQMIWLPDVVLYNNADGDYVVTKMTKATISPNGGVSWTPPAIFKSHCDIDVEFFPFDMQYCWLKFGIWSYSATEIDIKHSRLKTANDTEWVEEGIDLSAYYHSVEWALIRVSAQKHIVKYPCCEYPFNDLTFYITLRRKTLFYTINLIIPCVSITLLTLLEFYLPSDCGEKISLCISVLLSLSLFQLLLMEIIPPTSIKVPLVGKYILLTTIFVSLSVMFTVLILNINFRRDTSHEMPRWMKRLFLDLLPRYLWMTRPPAHIAHLQEHREFQQKACHSDLSNYENPYKETFKPLYKEMSTENLFHKVSFNTTFIGMANLDMASYCQACLENIRSKYPPHVLKALDGVPYVAQHMKQVDDGDKVKAQWVYMALVVDRILLWTYLTVCGFSTAYIFLNAPALYDRKSPLGEGTV